jgi:hypothetical protein
VGHDVGASSTLKIQNRSDGSTSHNSNQLNLVQGLQIPRTTTGFSLNERSRDIIYLAGIKLCLQFTNISSDDLYLNVALVSTKSRGELNTTDFFRCYDGTARQIDFDSGTLSAMDRHCLPINSDEINVHWHERQFLKFNSNGSATSPKDRVKTSSIEKYIPIKRQIRFEGSGTDSETRFYLCHWTGLAGATIAASSSPVANTYGLDFKMIGYYKEPMYQVKGWK